MSKELTALSQELRERGQAKRHVAAVHARPRFSSSGVFWRPESDRDRGAHHSP